MSGVSIPNMIRALMGAGESVVVWAESVSGFSSYFYADGRALAEDLVEYAEGKSRVIIKVPKWADLDPEMLAVIVGLTTAARPVTMVLAPECFVPRDVGGCQIAAPSGRGLTGNGRDTRPMHL